MKIARSSGKLARVNAFIALLVKLFIVSVIFWSIPFNVRSFQAVNLSIQLFVFLIMIASLLRMLAIWKYVLKLSIDNNNLTITEHFFFNKNIKINKPVDISCRILGRGIGRVLYIKSAKDGSERYFGRELDSADQDEIVSWVQSNQ